MKNPKPHTSADTPPPVAFYYTIAAIGAFLFWQSSRSVILHRDRVPHTGPFILAANHISPLDPALLIRHTPRMLEFLTMGELLQGRMAWFFRGMNSIPLDRNRADLHAVRIAKNTLKNGRAVGLFPEGRIRDEQDSVVLGASFDPGLFRLARIAKVPILPAVVTGTRPYLHWQNWLPTKSVHYGINYGQPFSITRDLAHDTQHLSSAFVNLHAELLAAMNPLK